MTNKIRKYAPLAGVGFCLLAGVFLTGGDVVRAEDGAASQTANRAGQHSARDVFGQTFRQSFNLRDNFGGGQKALLPMAQNINRPRFFLSPSFPPPLPLAR